MRALLTRPLRQRAAPGHRNLGALCLSSSFGARHLLRLEVSASIPALISQTPRRHCSQSCVAQGAQPAPLPANAPSDTDVNELLRDLLMNSVCNFTRLGK